MPSQNDTMQLDLTSILLVSQIVSVACGLMFALDARRERTGFGFWFACAFLSAPVASVFYLLPRVDGSWTWADPVGNALSTFAISLTWIGARAVNGRSLPYSIAIAVPAVIALAVLLTRSPAGPWTGALPFFLSFAGFAVMAAVEFWRGGLEDEHRLRQSTILAIICAINAVWYLARAVGLVTLGADSWFFRHALGPEVTAVLVLVLIVVASINLVAITRERALRQTAAYAAQDSLTGLLNRREFIRRVEQLSERREAGAGSCALLLFDLDHFKAVNDTHGHLVGDEVLKAFARIARAALRRHDLLCRYGGEEFAALLPDVAPDEAFAIAERIRLALESNSEGVLGRVKPTTSIGIAMCGTPDIPLFALMEQADHALYRSKNEGRNRTSIAGDLPSGWKPPRRLAPQSSPPVGETIDAAIISSKP